MDDMSSFCEALLLTSGDFCQEFQSHGVCSIVQILAVLYRVGVNTSIVLL